MRVCNLSSGSDGNLTYIETQSTKLLVDCGLSCSEIAKRLSLINVDCNDIDAIIITHEHSDHIKGLSVFAKKYRANIYAHDESWCALEKLVEKIDRHRLIHFASQKFYINDLNIDVIDLSHDAVKCCGFCFEENGKKISIITDLGYTNSRILEQVRDSKLIYIEANYDLQMLLDNPKYSIALKRRIMGKKGHLSNVDCANALCEIIKHAPKKHIMLSHMSTKNNSLEAAYNTICSILEKNNIIVGQDVTIGFASINPSSIFNLR